MKISWGEHLPHPGGHGSMCIIFVPLLINPVRNPVAIHVCNGLEDDRDSTALRSLVSNYALKKAIAKLKSLPSFLLSTVLATGTNCIHVIPSPESMDEKSESELHQFNTLHAYGTLNAVLLQVLCPRHQDSGTRVHCLV